MTLEKAYRDALASYAESGFDQDNWQWNDEGRVYCLMDYLSSMGEFTDEDYAFGKEEGIYDLMLQVQDDMAENDDDGLKEIEEQVQFCVF